jgi:hypothetical protein
MGILMMMNRVLLCAAGQHEQSNAACHIMAGDGLLQQLQA